MDMQTAVKTVLSKYADFSGRARRSEYWYWILATALLSIVLNIVDAILGVPVLGTLVSLALLVPNLAVGARRLHDTGKSGWLQLLALTIIGIIPLIVFYCQDSTPGPNKHGANPKESGSFDAAPSTGYGTPPPGF